MTPFHPETFLAFMEKAVMGLANNADDPKGTTAAGTAAAVQIAHGLVLLGVEMNTNFNRIAVAQEAMLDLARADFTEAVEAAVQEQTETAVNLRMKEKEKRSFIGQKPD